MPAPLSRTDQPDARRAPPVSAAAGLPSPHVAQGHRALDWLARRHDGESIALIAHRAGVTPDTVKVATAKYGPFPRATQHLGRTIASDATLDARARRWVRQRRAGRTVTDIARDAGVAHQTVSAATIEHGPFPSPDVVTAWVEDRRHGRTIAAIAYEWTVRPATVRNATRPHGPFRTPGPRLPDGVVGVKGIANLARVTAPTVSRWVANGVLPAPDFVTARGRPLWLQFTVTRWLASTKTLATCPECGARCLSVIHHRQAHLDPRSSPKRRN